MTVLLFARSGLYAERAQRPGLARIVSSLFQVTVVSLIFAAGQRPAVLELLHLLRHASFFAVIILGSARWGYERVTGALLRAAGYRRRAVLVGSGRHIEDVAHALTRRGARAGRDGRLHLAHAAAGQRPALAGADRGRRPRCSTSTAIQEVIIADPDFPQERAVELVDTCHQRGVTVRDRAVDDGDPRPARGVRARARRCRCSSCARRSSTASTSSSSARSTSSSRRFLLLVLSPLLALIALRRAAVLARADHLPLLPARASAASRSPA